jgi:hypothetical protein
MGYALLGLDSKARIIVAAHAPDQRFSIRGFAFLAMRG